MSAFWENVVGNVAAAVITAGITAGAAAIIRRIYQKHQAEGRDTCTVAEQAGTKYPGG